MSEKKIDPAGGGTSAAPGKISRRDNNSARTTLPDTSALLPGFVWGAATSAFQIEGAEKDRGQSIWDTFCREPGRIVDGSDGSIACDHVARYRQDVTLLSDLGVDAYRFSVAWPRMMPTGRGKLAEPGLAFYDRLVDELLAAGVQPWVTLYHWDLPQTLQNEGGWAARETVGAFVDYATAVHSALGDRVSNWMTLNEPWCSAWLGHAAGEHAPGLSDLGRAAASAHHLLLAHGAATAALRAQAPADHTFGIVLNPATYRAADELDAADAAAVQSAARLLDGVQTRWWLDALLLGRYPADTLELLAPYLDGVLGPDDLAVICQPIDFLGINYYSDLLLQPRSREGAAPVPELPGTETVSLVAPQARPGREVTGMGWPITPDGLRALLVRINQEYPPVPLYITENGSAFEDPEPADDVPAAEPLPDPQRVDYLVNHLSALNAAAVQGVDVRGYFAWSLLDNFEWARGYTQRFGLVHVDFASQARRPRSSFHTYREIVSVQRHGGAVG